MNKLYILKITIIIIIVIFILSNLYYILSKKLKHDNNTYEKYINRELGSVSILNNETSDRITDILDNINNDQLDTSIYQQIKNLNKRAQDLYDDILDDTDKCENAYDNELKKIIKDYNVQDNLQCTENATDIEGQAVGRSFKDCANKCLIDNNCSSFSFDFTNSETANAKRCRLSSNCHKDTLTTQENGNSNVYVKKDKTDIFKYKILKDKVCDPICFKDSKDIEPNEVSDINQCAINCETGSNCKAFEFEFPSSNNNNKAQCKLRSICNETNFVKDSNSYNCYYDDISGTEIKTLEFDKDEILGMSINSFNEDRLTDLIIRNCEKECNLYDNCKGFDVIINDTERKCKLYGDFSIGNSTNKVEFCEKPTKIKKHLYSKIENGNVIDGTETDTGIKISCDGLCETKISDENQYMKFYKRDNDKNYSYIIFADTYNISNNTLLNLNDYEFIEIKFGWKVTFYNTLGDVIHTYQNPSSGDITDITKNVNLDNEYDIFTRISLNNIANKSIIDSITFEKLDDRCLVRYDKCEKGLDNVYRKNLIKINGNPYQNNNSSISDKDFNYLGSSCNFGSDVQLNKKCEPVVYLEDNNLNLDCKICSPADGSCSLGTSSLSYNEIKNKPTCNSIPFTTGTPNEINDYCNDLGELNVMLNEYNNYPDLSIHKTCILKKDTSGNKKSLKEVVIKKYNEQIYPPIQRFSKKINQIFTVPVTNIFVLSNINTEINSTKEIYNIKAEFTNVKDNLITQQTNEKLQYNKQSIIDEITNIDEYINNQQIIRILTLGQQYDNINNKYNILKTNINNSFTQYKAKYEKLIEQINDIAVIDNIDFLISKNINLNLLSLKNLIELDEYLKTFKQKINEILIKIQEIINLKLQILDYNNALKKLFQVMKNLVQPIITRLKQIERTRRKSSRSTSGKVAKKFIKISRGF